MTGMTRKVLLAALSEMSEELLLAALINKARREDRLQPAPKVTHRVGPAQSVILGIGKDHVAEVVLFDEDLEALDKLMELS